MKQKASAQWQGTLKEGSGTMSTGSGAFVNKPYSIKTRFEGEQPLGYFALQELP